MNEIRFIISLSARSTQQVHKRFFHIFSLSLFCRPSFYPFLLLLTSPVSKAHRRFGHAQSRENWHLRSFFPVNSAPPCWKIGRNRHQDRSALSSFSFLRSLRVTFEGLAVWGVFFFFFFTGAVMMSKWEIRLFFLPCQNEDKGKIHTHTYKELTVLVWPLFAPSIEVWIADGGIFHGARAHKPNTHTHTDTHTGFPLSRRAAGHMRPAEEVTPPPYVTATRPPQAQISITHPNLSLPHPPHHRHNQNPPSVSHSPNRPAPLFSLPSAVRWRSDIISAQTDTHRISNPSSRLCATLTPKAVVGLWLNRPFYQQHGVWLKLPDFAQIK